MSVCRRNGRCIAHLAGHISDRDYYADVVTPRTMDLTGNGAMLEADEMRKRFLKGEHYVITSRRPSKRSEE